MTTFIDNLFAPIIQFLQLCISKLSEIGTIAAKGIRLDHYFGFFGILGEDFGQLISSLLAAVAFLFVLYMIQKYSRVLLWFKDLIKWW